MNNEPEISAAIVQRSIHGDQGGLATFTALLCDALAGCGVRTTLITRMEEAGREAMVLPGRPEITLRFAGLRRKPSPAVFRDSRFARAVEETCRGNACRVIHTQDLWTAEVHLGVRAAGKLGLPLVMSVTGTLTPWSLRHKSLKKRIGWLLYQKRDLASAAVLHATSRREAEDIRRRGLANPIAVIPLAVSLPETGKPAVRTPGDRRGYRTALYLSRIHEKKGLINLIRAWDRIRPRGWRAVIAGQDDFGYRAVLEGEIRRRGLTSDFLFRGFVSPEEKELLYREADLFVLPSYSENFGLVIPEALARSLPVITTRGTPWEELESRRCGWWIGTGADPLEEALRAAFALPDEERREMGRRGRKLVEEEYSPGQLGRRMRDLYRWLIAGGSPPPFIVFE